MLILLSAAGEELSCGHCLATFNLIGPVTSLCHTAWHWQVAATRINNTNSRNTEVVLITAYDLVLVATLLVQQSNMPVEEGEYPAVLFQLDTGPGSAMSA
jgi:hypothetical protein